MTNVVQIAPLSSEARAAKLAGILASKVEQGYEIESQSNDGAVLLSRPSRKWFGFRARGVAIRQVLTIDEGGRSTTRLEDLPTVTR